MNTYQILTRIVKEKICEEAPANVVGAGQVAGVGVGPQGEPAGQPALLKTLKMLKRKAPKAVEK